MFCGYIWRQNFYQVSQKHGVEKHSECINYVVKREVSYVFGSFSSLYHTEPKIKLE